MAAAPRAVGEVIEGLKAAAILSVESSSERPAAVTRSLLARAALTMERPMWPVAPKIWWGEKIVNYWRCLSQECKAIGLTIQIRCWGGLFELGGSQLAGN